jgi:L-ascorbate metabolism protein UlaG (beta-lactamase superfamily)
MKLKWLGWAGVEIEAEGATVLIDPLADAAATFAALGDRAGDVQLPELVEPSGGAVAGLISHLHRDHADAGALAQALSSDAAVHEPTGFGGDELENVALAQAIAELGKAGLERRAVETWGRVEAGPFTLMALPAVDGLGDPQVSWLVEAEGRRVLHLGDTIYHGYWWRMARRHGPFDLVLAPINGAVIDFPHLQPPSPLAAAMEPEQAAIAGEALRAGTVVPIHYGGLAIDPFYRPIADAAERFREASAGRSFDAAVLVPGETLEVSPGDSDAWARTAPARRRPAA